jgi:hypothetical protein
MANRKSTWTVQAYTPDADAWQTLPVQRPTKAAALRLAACISADFVVRTRVTKA